MVESGGRAREGSRRGARFREGNIVRQLAGDNRMGGAISNWDVFFHPFVTIRYFGWTVFFRSLLAGRDTTFLALVNRARPRTSQVSPLLERCISLELRAKRLYIALARGLDGLDPAANFFGLLAAQEQQHADLLEVCRLAANRDGWKAGLFNPWQDYLPRLERQMQAAEIAASAVDSVEDAVMLALQIESSEVNLVFDAALAASDSNFVRKLRPFRKAMELHMSYLVEAIPRLAPNLLTASRDLRARFPRVPR